jgi:hypothetical protein
VVGVPAEGLGWRAAETAEVEKFAACLGVDPSLVGDPTPNDQKAKFKGDKLKFGRDQEIESSATVEESPTVASLALQFLGKAGATGCFQDFFNGGIRAALNSGAGGTSLPAGVSLGDIEVQAVTLPLHTDAVVYRAALPFSFAGVSVVGRFDFVFAVRGRVDLSFTFSNLGDPFPEDLEVQVMNAVIDRTPAS